MVYFKPTLLVTIVLLVEICSGAPSKESHPASKPTDTKTQETNYKSSLESGSSSKSDSKSSGVSVSAGDKEYELVFEEDAKGGYSKDESGVTDIYIAKDVDYDKVETTDLGISDIDSKTLEAGRGCFKSWYDTDVYIESYVTRSGSEGCNCYVINSNIDSDFTDVSTDSTTSLDGTDIEAVDSEYQVNEKGYFKDDKNLLVIGEENNLSASKYGSNSKNTYGSGSKLNSESHTKTKEDKTPKNY